MPGKNGETATIDVVPILLSREPRYDAKKGGGLFDYMQFRLLAIEAEAKTNGDRWRAKLENGQPVLLDPKGLESFHEQIGRNTSYIIHPEEVLADNFMILIGGKRKVQTPRILDEMRKPLPDSYRSSNAVADRAAARSQDPRTHARHDSCRRSSD